MTIIGRINSNSTWRRDGQYALYLRGPVPADAPKVLVSAVDLDSEPRQGWCELISSDDGVLYVLAVQGWYPVNGDVLIAAKMVPAPPPMMAVAA